jgi:hypothetical protein
METKLLRQIHLLQSAFWWEPRWQGPHIPDARHFGRPQFSRMF